MILKDKTSQTPEKQFGNHCSLRVLSRCRLASKQARVAPGLGTFQSRRAPNRRKSPPPQTPNGRAGVGWVGEVGREQYLHRARGAAMYCIVHL